LKEPSTRRRLVGKKGTGGISWKITGAQTFHTTEEAVRGACVVGAR